MKSLAWWGLVAALVAACSASSSAKVRGVCGEANGTTVTSAPTSGLCAAGVASATWGSGPFTWTCAGTAGASSASCSTTASGTPTPTQVCGSSMLAGPSAAPSGAVVVPAGDNSALTPNYAVPGFSVPHTTFWFAPGVHTLGSDAYAQIQPGDGSTYLGAPGAVISGQKVNMSAFTGSGNGVTIEYLTVQDFASAEGQMVVNHDGGSGWTIRYNTIQDNSGGAGVGLGPDTIVDSNCLTNNAEYGFSSICAGASCDPLTGGPANVALTNNEVSLNDSAGAYDQPGGESCGCSGGGKLWHVHGATITGNYLHDNGNVGLWADTDNAGLDISGNTISDNYAEGIVIEVSYNFSITHNVLSGNAWGAGPNLPGFPVSAIYISESGGDARVPGAYSGVALIQGNTLTDNWGGVVLWENADRYCSSGLDQACTLVDPATFTMASCAANLPSAQRGQVTGSPAADYYDGCRWKTQNVQVLDNRFEFTPAHIPGCSAAAACGSNGVFSNYGSRAPYTSSSIPTATAFDQGNQFQGNAYLGPFSFWVWNQGNTVSYPVWSGEVTDRCSTPDEVASGACSSGFGQDAGSTTE